MLIPESLSNNATMPEGHRDLFLYCNAVMEPWDGPAAIAATDGRWIIAGLDRNGLRPMRYTVTHDGLLVTGSETGMVKLAEERIAAKGRVGPGQCIGVDLDTGRFLGDAELKDELAARKPFGQWTERTTRIDDIVKADAVETPVFGAEELRRRQLAVGYTWRSWKRSCTRWWRTGARPWAPWATTRPWPCCPRSTAACTTTSARPSAKSPTRRSTACAKRG
jgi:glutamate synthase (NADPH/NADH) large chain